MAGALAEEVGQLLAAVAAREGCLVGIEGGHFEILNCNDMVSKAEGGGDRF